MPVSLTRSSAEAPLPEADTPDSPSWRSVTAISPSKVNLKALDTKLRMTFSHRSRSTKTGSVSFWQSTTNRSPARSMAARKTLASSTRAARLVGSCSLGSACLNREKSIEY